MYTYNKCIIYILIWWTRNCPPINYVYQMVNIMLEMSTKFGIVIYIYCYNKYIIIIININVYLKQKVQHIIPPII